ncbi:hypothetical protein MMC26_005453 [Xylographa opegraphella]|nr:hypothetical protein [Xylographa opegraphella]
MDTLHLLPRASPGANYTAITDYRNHCTLETCPLSQSYYAYRPSLPANALFLALFSFSLLCFLVQALLSRRFIGFTIALVCGCILEVVGYAGRIISYINPFDQNGFLVQICCLTIAPAFMAAGLYLCLSRIVNTFGRENSRIAPLSYPRIFIPCDIVSLLLQAIGGAMASIASHQNKSADNGDHIMVAGLAFQVLTLLIFMVLCADFAVKTLRRMKTMGEQALDPTYAKLRQSWSFKTFLVALALATVCIFIRSVYRVAELSAGWEGALIKNQNLFIGLEGVMVVIAVLALNAFHPGFCFREGYDMSLKKVKSKKSKRGDVEKESPSRDEAGSENAIVPDA